MPAARFDLERTRLEAAQQLPPTCFDDFQRLVRSIVHGPQVQWLLVDAPDDTLRKTVMTALDGVLRQAGLRVAHVPLGRAVPDVPALEQRLVAVAGRSDVVHVLGARDWFDARAWDAFNVRRERIAATVRARLVFWLDPAAIALASQGAPDLWAWRAGVYAFRPAAGGALALPQPQLTAHGFARRDDPVELRSMSDKHRRIAEIRAWLAANAEAPDDLLVAPMDELGLLLSAVGDMDATLVHLREQELPLHRRRQDDRAIAITMSKIADVLEDRGDLDEALRIRREEALPVFERLGDLRLRAVTTGQIANVLRARGDLDEALRIHREDELPVFERLGDVRARAVTMSQIADLLQIRGDLDEALRIRREDQLPVFEKLGDLRLRAVTMGQIADVLRARGDLDEALRIHREEVLPVFEKLGDLHSRAVTMGKIADVLQARGDLDEALRIQREEELPVYDKLGDLRARAVTVWKIAVALWQRQERAEATTLFRQAHVALRKARLPEAEALARQMRTLGLDVPED